MTTDDMAAWFVVVFCLFQCGGLAPLGGVGWLLYVCAQGPTVCYYVHIQACLKETVLMDERTHCILLAFFYNFYAS